MSSMTLASATGAGLVARASSSPDPRLSSEISRRPVSTMAFESGPNCGPTHRPISCPRYFARKPTTFGRPTRLMPIRRAPSSAGTNCSTAGARSSSVVGVAQSVDQLAARFGEHFEFARLDCLAVVGRPNASPSDSPAGIASECLGQRPRRTNRPALRRRSGSPATFAPRRGSSSRRFGREAGRERARGRLQRAPAAGRWRRTARAGARA